MLGQRAVLIAVLVLGLAAGIYFGTRNARPELGQIEQRKNTEKPLSKRAARAASHTHSTSKSPDQLEEPPTPDAAGVGNHPSDKLGTSPPETLAQPDPEKLSKAWHWPENGGPEHDLAGDDEACRKESNATDSAGDQLGAYVDCMTARGWANRAADVDACRKQAANPRTRHLAYDTCMRSKGWRWQPPAGQTVGRLPQYYAWATPNVPKRNRTADSNACRKYAWLPVVRVNAYDRCMKEKGWDGR